MKSILIIAANTYREIIRDRILYGLIVFALLLIGLSLALGQLSFAEQTRISANFGLTAIHISAVMIAIFMGSSLVNKEIDKKTILTLFVRPISRLQFLLGKSLGLVLLILTAIGGLALVLMGVFLGIGLGISSLFFVALLGIILEALILLAVSLFFSAFATPVMVVAFSLGIFVIGHWTESLRFFAQKNESIAFEFFSILVIKGLPNFELFNWRSHMIYNHTISGWELASAGTYAILWFVFLMSATVFIFKGKDFA